MIFILLVYSEVHKKNFSALDIVESRVKRSGCVDIIGQVSWTQSSIFLFLDVPDPEL